jgi:hypothetical protein
MASSLCAILIGFLLLLVLGLWGVMGWLIEDALKSPNLFGKIYGGIAALVVFVVSCFFIRSGWRVWKLRRTLLHQPTVMKQVPNPSLIKRPPPPQLPPTR